MLAPSMGRSATAALGFALALALVPGALSAQSRTFPEELPDEATSGPRFDPARAARAVALAGVSGARSDPADPDLPVALAFHLGVGYAMPSSIDRALATHLYADQSGGPMVTGDFQLTYRALDWLFLGGRFGFRGRGWGRDGEAGAQAGGFDLMAMLHVRGQLGRIFNLGAMVGAGGGVVGLLLNRNVALGVAPRLSGGVEIGFRLGRGVRLEIRGSWDFFPWFDIDADGHDLDLGGPSVAVGLEVRS